MATLKVNRGTTFRMGYQHQHDGQPHTLVGSIVYFTVKAEEYDNNLNDTSAKIKKDVFSGDASGFAEITILPEDTRSLEPGSYTYDIKVKEPSGDIYKMDEGKFILDGSPTNRGV